MSIWIARQVGVAWFVDSHAGLNGQLGANGITRSGERAAEYVETRAKVAGAAGRERAHDESRLDRARRGEFARGGWWSPHAG
jgi:hypothetical protein